jgi:indole-3-glycerol phosphate synthase
MIIEEILKAKEKALAKRMCERPLGQVAMEAAKRKTPSFSKALASRNDVKVICEYKRASPSGLVSKKPLEKTVRAYEKGGAAAVSVLTEQNYFRGSLGDLAKATATVSIPILRKDFITTEYELYEAKAKGASAALLISGVCDVGLLLGACRKIGLDALVETKNEREIGGALDAGARIIGINNRSFSDLSVDLDRTERLCGLVPETALLVSESGFKNVADVKKLAACERVPDAALVGTAVMEAGNALAKVRELVEVGKGLKGQ